MKNIAADPYRYGYNARARGVPLEEYINIKSAARDGMTAEAATLHFQELWKEGWWECHRDTLGENVVPESASSIVPVEDHRRDAREEPCKEKECPNCHRKFPLTLQHWYWRRTEGSRGKWAPRCILCYRQEQIDREYEYRRKERQNAQGIQPEA